jgi:hypothetical protein
MTPEQQQMAKDIVQEHITGSSLTLEFNELKRNLSWNALGWAKSSKNDLAKVDDGQIEGLANLIVENMRPAWCTPLWCMDETWKLPLTLPEHDRLTRMQKKPTSK